CESNVTPGGRGPAVRLVVSMVPEPSVRSPVPQREDGGARCGTIGAGGASIAASMGGASIAASIAASIPCPSLGGASGSDASPAGSGNVPPSPALPPAPLPFWSKEQATQTSASQSARTPASYHETQKVPTETPALMVPKLLKALGFETSAQNRPLAPPPP